MANIFGFVGICVSLLAFFITIIALAIAQWQTLELGYGSVNGGLWEVCIVSSRTESCSYLNSDYITDDELLGYYRDVRAMVILGILLLAGSIVVGILVMFVMKSTKMLYFVAGGLDIAAGLFLMIGMAIYADKIKDESYDYGAVFALDIVAWLAAWAGGGMFVGANIMDKE